MSARKQLIGLGKPATSHLSAAANPGLAKTIQRFKNQMLYTKQAGMRLFCSVMIKRYINA
jgi:hypothetical protein